MPVVATKESKISLFLNYLNTDKLKVSQNQQDCNISHKMNFPQYLPLPRRPLPDSYSLKISDYVSKDKSKLLRDKKIY